MEERGIPISHLAAAIGVTYTHLTNVINGVSTLTNKMEIRIKSVL